MNGSEPRDAQGSGGKSQSPSSPPELVFKPDVRQTVRVARVRTITLLAAAVLMVVALYLIISYRPPPVVLSGEAAAGDTSLPTESVSSTVPQAAVQPAAVPRRAGGAEIARSAAAMVDTLVAAAGEKWLRAAELLPPGVVTADDAEDAAAQLRKAVVIVDSARRDMALARRQAEVVLRLSRETGSRTAFRLGVLYTALDRYLNSMGDDADDRYAYFVKSEASVKAMVLGDEAESETQQNVANSYLRSSEDRQTSIKRLEQQVREALGNLESVGR